MEFQVNDKVKFKRFGVIRIGCIVAIKGKRLEVVFTDTVCGSCLIFKESVIEILE